MDYNKGKILVYNAILRKVHVLEKKIFKIDNENKIISVNDDLAYPDPLLKTSIILNSDTPELDLVRYQCNNCYNEISQRNGTSITLVLTNECNFACEYCFEETERTGFEKKFGEDGFVSDFVVNGTLELAKRISKKSDDFSLGLYGGDPLLAPKKTMKIIDLFYNNIKKDDVEFSLSMVTNGYNLTEEVVDYLNTLELKEIGFQISLDGTKEVHDSRRKLKGGGPTFDRILKNIQYFVNTYKGEFQLNISPVVDKTNSESVLELGKQLKELGLLEKVKFTAVGRDVALEVNGSLISDCHNMTFTDEEYAIFWRDFSTKMMSMLGIPYLKFINKNLGPCGVAQLKSFTVDVDGSIYMCQGDLGTPNRSIGNVKDKSISLFNKTILEYLTHKPWDFPDCKECRLLPICIPERCIRLRMLNIDCTDKQKAMKKAIMLDMYDFAIGLDRMSQFKFDHSEFSEDLFYEIKQ